MNPDREHPVRTATCAGLTGSFSGTTRRQSEATRGTAVGYASPCKHASTPPPLDDTVASTTACCGPIKRTRLVPTLKPALPLGYDDCSRGDCRESHVGKGGMGRDEAGWDGEGWDGEGWVGVGISDGTGWIGIGRGR